MDNPYGVIYKLTSPSGKVYVGQTTDFAKRMYTYAYKGCRMQRYLSAAIKKYGWGSFTKEIIDSADYQEYLDFLESYYIEKLGTMDEAKGYNLKSGGANGSPSQSTRARISAALRNRPLSDSTKAKMSISRRGVPKSAAHRAGMSAGAKLREARKREAKLRRA
jgi:group I intron endonuclease